MTTLRIACLSIVIAVVAAPPALAGKARAVSSNENLARAACLAAIERFPPFQPIKQTPGTIGDFNAIMQVLAVPGGFAINWQTVNVYRGGSTKVALRGMCRVSADGRRVTKIMLRP